MCLITNRSKTVQTFVRNACVSTALSLAFPMVLYGGSLSDDLKIEEFVKIVDVKENGDETTGVIQNISNHWLSRVQLIVKHHPLHEDGRSDKREAGGDSHSDVVIDEAIPPGGSVEFRTPLSPQLANYSLIATDVSVISVNPFMKK